MYGICVWMFAYAYVCMYECICMNAYVYVCMYECMLACAYSCSYIHHTWRISHSHTHTLIVTYSNTHIYVC